MRKNERVGDYWAKQKRAKFFLVSCSWMDGWTKKNGPYCRRMPWPGIEPMQSKQKMGIWGIVEFLSPAFFVVVVGALLEPEPAAVEDLERID